jgi:hypothetical protein
MGRFASVQQQARVRARLRRIALDYDRAARDERVEAAAAEAILALGERDDALGHVQAAEGRAGDALRRIIAEGIKVDGLAQLCDVSVGEVRRLRRAAEAAQDSRGIAEVAGPDPAGPHVSDQGRDDVQARPRGMDRTKRPPQQRPAPAGPDETSKSSWQVRVAYPHPTAP